MAATIIAVPESVKAAQLASIEKLGKRLQDSNSEEGCIIDLVPEAFNCAVCHDLFVKPRQCFPCRHSFCEPCLRQLADSEINRDADYCSCPLCRGPIHYSRPDKSLEAEIARSSVAHLYAERYEAYANNLEMQAKPLPGLAWLEFLPSIISPSYRRVNRVVSFITYVLLWLSAKSTRSLLLDWMLLRTPDFVDPRVILSLLVAITMLLLTVSKFARSAPPEIIRWFEQGADYCSARRMLPETCPAPHFPDPLEVYLEVSDSDYVLPVEAYVCDALCVFMLCAYVGPLVRRYCGFLRLGNAVSFIGVCGTCACALFSLLRCLTWYCFRY